MASGKMRTRLQPSRLRKGRKTYLLRWSGKHSGIGTRQREILELASDLLAQPGPWLRTPNPQLGDRAPIDLIGGDEEYRVYNLLHAVDQGLF